MFSVTRDWFCCRLVALLGLVFSCGLVVWVSWSSTLLVCFVHYRFLLAFGLRLRVLRLVLGVFGCWWWFVVVGDWTSFWIWWCCSLLCFLGLGGSCGVGLI